MPPSPYSLQADMHGLIVTTDESPSSLLQLLIISATYAHGELARQPKVASAVARAAG